MIPVNDTCVDFLLHLAKTELNTFSLAFLMCSSAQSLRTPFARIVENRSPRILITAHTG